MSKQLKLDIVAPDQNLFSDLVDMVIVRTTEGDVGIMYDHEPTVAPLAIGALRIIQGETQKVAACSGGFINVEEDKITIITDAAEWAEGIDKARAEAAKSRAENRLVHEDKEIDVNRARVSLRRAINRIHAADTHIRHENL
ncbi:MULTISPECIES: F0F1 ATP synthase subunit epsilon [unclassified Fusibacter]|uniref:F0F1 ATP synthase subunit epsilon n=1 Tax=unclassified Fusibacter TaxID=2624464 RepID=UPI001010F1BE|nr:MULTISPECIES: F0F1 ATP synthase subunit epsilon [unclassified Fusibacter]MCK8059857.1 F0F1 ATP synthase subunit epsilon [Fusibacter sp. A2]NPE21659.1 F0F1 ATP synthase subunit epsilon [Fusibacter sp. A1]RXV62063.1 F0F1 ATP synthase subunit epsilon [Fusibacter sp. A1]